MKAQKLISLILSLILCLGMFPISAFADETAEEAAEMPEFEEAEELEEAEDLEEFPDEVKIQQAKENLLNQKQKDQQKQAALAELAELALMEEETPAEEPEDELMAMASETGFGWTYTNYDSGTYYPDWSWMQKELTLTPNQSRTLFFVYKGATEAENKQLSLSDVKITGTSVTFTQNKNGYLQALATGEGKTTVEYNGESMVIDVQLPDVGFYKTNQATFANYSTSHTVTSKNNSVYIINRNADVPISNVALEDSDAAYGTITTVTEGKVYKLTFNDNLPSSEYIYVRYSYSDGSFISSRSIGASFQNRLDGIYLGYAEDFDFDTETYSVDINDYFEDISNIDLGYATYSAPILIENGVGKVIPSDSLSYDKSILFIETVDESKDIYDNRFAALKEGETTITYKGFSRKVKVTKPAVAAIDAATFEAKGKNYTKLTGADYGHELMITAAKNYFYLVSSTGTDFIVDENNNDNFSFTSEKIAAGVVKCTVDVSKTTHIYGYVNVRTEDYIYTYVDASLNILAKGLVCGVNTEDPFGNEYINVYTGVSTSISRKDTATTASANISYLNYFDGTKLVKPAAADLTCNTPELAEISGTSSNGYIMLKVKNVGQVKFTHKDGSTASFGVTLPTVGLYTKLPASFETLNSGILPGGTYYAAHKTEGYKIDRLAAGNHYPLPGTTFTKNSDGTFTVVIGKSVPDKSSVYLKAVGPNNNNGKWTMSPRYMGVVNNKGVAAKTLSKLEVTKACTAVYTVGDTFKPSDVVISAVYSDGSKEVVTPSFNVSTFTKEGKISVTASFSGKTVTFTVTVNKAPIEGLGALKAEGLYDMEYTGKAVVLSELKVYCGEYLLQSTDYTVKYKNNKAVGTADVVITLKNSEFKGFGFGDNGTDILTAHFNVVPADLSEAVMSTIKAQTYSGAELKPKAAFKLGKTSLKAGKDYEIVYSNNVEIGEASVTITGMGNYTGTACGTFRINGAPISKAKVTLVPKTVMYTGEAQNPLTLTYGKEKKVLTEGEDYAVHFVNDNSKVGKVLYWIEGLGNFEGTTMGTEAKPKNFKINPYDIKKDTENRIEFFYDPEHPELEFGGQALTEGVDYTVTSKEAKGITTYTFKGKGNFKGTWVVKFDPNEL